MLEAKFDAMWRHSAPNACAPQLSRGLAGRLVAASLVFIGTVLMAAQAAVAEERGGASDRTEKESDARLYRTPAERREVGLKRQIAPWLTASGLLEVETVREELTVKGPGNDEHSDVTAATLQLGLDATFGEFAKAELVVEYDTESRQVFTEEAIVAVEMEPWELEAGMQYLPFGKYISHFATGPLLEFGETRAPAATVSYGRDERLDLALSVYRSNTKEVGTDSRGLSWAIAMDAWPTESLLFGWSYESNLADSDDRLLEDENDRYLRKVPGLSGYLVWIGDTFEVTFEALGATRSFLEKPPENARPRAWNLEFIHFTRPDFEWALRLEGSRELEDAPRLQYGASITWRLRQRASLTLDYLHGRFKGDDATNDDDEPYDHVDWLGAQFSVAF